MKDGDSVDVVRGRSEADSRVKGIVRGVVDIRLFHNVEMSLDHSRNGLKPFFMV